MAIAALASIEGGCASLPSARQAVDRVDVIGSSQVSPSELEGKIATSESPRFLGIWDGMVFQYAYYDRFVLQQDLERLERYYRAKGYYSAKVRAARVIPTDKPGHVRVEIEVTEGPPTIVRQVTTSGMNSVPFEHQAAIINVMNKGLRVGQILSEDEYEDTKDAIALELMNRGFAWVTVTGKVKVDLLSQVATVQYIIDAGPLFYVRDVHFEGLEDLPESTIRRVFSVRSGDRFSARAMGEGKNALLDLGVLADVQVSWTQPLTGKVALKNAKNQPIVDVTVRCTPGPLRTIKLGLGTELDTIRTDIHAVVGWEDRNFLGGLRKFAITAKPGMVLYPTKVGRFETPNRVLLEGRLFSSLRQPGLFDPRLTGVLRGNAAIFPVLFHTNTDDVILGYRELKGAIGIERPFFNNRLWMATFFDAQAYYPFTYVGDLDSDLQRVFIRYIEVLANVDFRDNSVRPHKGVFIGNTVQFAGGFLGGSVSDVKWEPEVRLYAPISSNVTFAVRGAIGLLFPRNYGKALDDQLRDADTRDQQLLYFRAFFSGGPSSNRGYAYRGVGPHGPGGFLAPNLSAVEFRERCSMDMTQDVCRVPLGGLTLWEATAEVRFPIIGPLTGATFVDASDVTRQTTSFTHLHPHVSAGGGLRYDTPVGPLRLDVGYRIPGLQNIGSDLSRQQERPGTVFGAPIAISIAVGQAF